MDTPYLDDLKKCIDYLDGFNAPDNNSPVMIVEDNCEFELCHADFDHQFNLGDLRKALKEVEDLKNGQ